MANYLGDHQFGAGIPCGGESILHAANRMLKLKVRKIATHFSLDMHAWYLDDDTIIGDTMEVSKAPKIIQKEGASHGLHLNIRKMEISWPAVDPRSLMAYVFLVSISKPSNGVKLLGGPVSLDIQFCSDMVKFRANKTVHLMNSVKKLKDPQSELLLLRNCTGVSKLYFTLRTINPQVLPAVTEHYDQQLLGYLQHIVTGDGVGFGILHQRFDTLPFGFGLILAITVTWC
ncbi:uncharacterized protein LOC113349746 [Papaver somniferum]|uniref:uncharacterized protein LOC113349746 n=1 Tax=Papaver somniferum TaxID=3469 RepID=UPI000E6F66B0|nr:uncharacterized protein LOC113349746 [Papaver somniferum]